MKFSCEKDLIIKSIDTVSKAIVSNNPIEILKGIKIEVNNNVTFLASDSNLFIESIFDADIKEEGTLVVDARIFYDIIKNIPDGKVTIYTNDKNEMKIMCENSQFTILYLSSETFPQKNVTENANTLKIYSKSLKEIIKNTLFAVSDDETRPILMGVCFEITKSTLRAIAIDKTRLALRNQIIPETEFSNLKFVIPSKVLSDISKILKDDSTIIDIEIDDNLVVFKFDKITVSSRLLQGEFIDYTKLIPKMSEIECRVNVKNIREMIERASIIINYDDPKIPVILKIKEAEINVECISKYGYFAEKLYVEKQGGNLKIGVNSKLILNALRSIEDENAKIEFTNMRGPFVIKPIEGDKFLYMVLPMELKE